MRMIYAPNKLEFSEKDTKIFLAGSIEMGKAEDWQTEMGNKLKDHADVVLFNPRRPDFYAEAKQVKEDEYFRGQVEWELNALDHADIIFMYLQPETKSVISLLEMGIHCKSGKLIVCCPHGFYRKGNVDITCEKYGTPVFENKEDAFTELVKRLSGNK